MTFFLKKDTIKKEIIRKQKKQKNLKDIFMILFPFLFSDGRYNQTVMDGNF